MLYHRRSAGQKSAELALLKWPACMAEEKMLLFFPLLQSLRYGADVWWHWAAMFEMQSTEMNAEGLFAHLLYLETTALV